MPLEPQNIDDFFEEDGYVVYPIEAKNSNEVKTIKKIEEITGKKQELKSLSDVIKSLSEALYEGQQEFKDQQLNKTR